MPLRDENDASRFVRRDSKRSSAGAVKPDDGALRRRGGLVQQARQRDAVRRFEPYEAAGWLGTICRSSASHRHILSRVRCAPPSQKFGIVDLDEVDRSLDHVPPRRRHREQRLRRIAFSLAGDGDDRHGARWPDASDGGEPRRRRNRSAAGFDRSGRRARRNRRAPASIRFDGAPLHFAESVARRRKARGVQTEAVAKEREIGDVRDRESD